MRVELPPEPVHFVNRHEERQRALRAVEEWRGRSRPLVLALSGPAGLGKTELARLLARTLLDRFPEGVLSVDLDDFRLDGVVDPGDVVAQLLGSLGVEPQLVEAQFTARCRQYWNKTAEARFVLIVDNARYASEVVPLLPASGGSVVIVASHGPLYDLEDGAAVDLALPPLEELAATELLRLIVRDHRLAADPESVRALVRLCDGLPAALHVAGRWVRAHRLRPLPRLISALHGEWEKEGVPGVERVWDTVCRGLSRPAGLLYRLLPHHPGATFTPDSATALLGLGQDACQEALEELDRAGLLDLRAVPGVEDGRIRLPGPLRAHALRRSRRDAEDGEVAAAQTRVLRWLVRQAQRADGFSAGRRLVVSEVFDPVPGAPDVPLEDPQEAADDAVRAERAERASRWLHDERHALFACVRLAYGRGMDAEAVALSEPVWTYALDHPHQSDVVQVFRLAVAAAVRHGQNAAWLVRTRCQLARPLWEAGELSDAERELTAADAAVGLLGDGKDDGKLRASVIESWGMLAGARGEWRAAADAFARSRDLHLAISNPYGVMLQTYRAGEARAKLGELETAHRLLSEAHEAAVTLQRERMTGRTAFALAGVLRRLGRTEEARGLYEQSLRGARKRRSGFDQARIHDAMAQLEEGAEGRGAAAGEHRAAAYDIRRRNGLV
ncbi:tetratricopeptide repeat protein [Streptomyces natalensis]|uniref:Regulatory protein n=1 Tax=Streptomyces natalensis ATCC 27448 TaxID=1240678 RepID=A0A0D7CUH7_9ACTN|nr:tetratricopeptide repeat protein [Streptomyces natalensis]KIZ19691.1 regulatory protein [Streptomyces natalensis ATCC 27448]